MFFFVFNEVLIVFQQKQVILLKLAQAPANRGQNSKLELAHLSEQSPA